MSRTNHLDISIGLVFRDRPSRLDLRKTLDLASAVKHAAHEPRVVFIVEGADSGESAEIIRRMLNELPSIKECFAGAQSTKYWDPWSSRSG